MTNQPRDEKEGAAKEGFDDWLPVKAEYIAPGEYKVVDKDGHGLWYMEGATFAEWVCEAINKGACQLPGAVEGQEDADLQLWFGLSYASWLTIPRVLMEAMPIEWQNKMAQLLNEYDAAFPNQPDIGTRVQVTENGKLIKTPDWLINYRRPDREAIDALRKEEQQ